MAAKDRIGKAGQAARAAQHNRYVQRLVEDEDLRRNLLTAYGAARSAYSRMGNGKPPTKALLQDRKLQRELSEAVQALRDASGSLAEGPKPARRKGGFGRLVVLTVLGAVLAVVFSEGLRSKVLDMLFGSEEEFDYSSTTAPGQPAPSPVQDATSAS